MEGGERREKSVFRDCFFPLFLEREKELIKVLVSDRYLYLFWKNNIISKI